MGLRASGFVEAGRTALVPVAIKRPHRCADYSDPRWIGGLNGLKFTNSLRSHMPSHALKGYALA